MQTTRHILQGGTVVGPADKRLECETGNVIIIVYVTARCLSPNKHRQPAIMAYAQTAAGPVAIVLRAHRAECCLYAKKFVVFIASGIEMWRDRRLRATVSRLVETTRTLSCVLCLFLVCVCGSLKKNGIGIDRLRRRRQTRVQGDPFKYAHIWLSTHQHDTHAPKCN